MTWVLLLAFSVGVLIAPPRWTVLLFWPVILVYPQNLLLGLLPSNVGLDDVFILSVGLRVLISPRRTVAKPVVSLALALALMQSLAEATGLLSYPDLLPHMIKTSLKGIVFVSFALVCAQQIRTPKDIERATIAFLVALVAAFSVVLICFAYPSLAEYWEVSVREYGHRVRAAGDASWRGFGPFSGPGSAGLMVCVAVPLGLGLVLERQLPSRVRWLGLATLILGIAVLVVCKSRSSILGLGGMFFLMTLMSRRRSLIVTIALISAVGAATYGSYGAVEQVEQVRARLEDKRLDSDLEGRARGWQEIVANPSPAIVLFGEGLPALARRLNVAPHNGYLDIVFLWGLGGVIIFIVFYTRIIEWSRAVARSDPSSLGRALAWALMWSTVATAGYALTADPWYVSNYRFVAYFLMTIVYVRYRAVRATRKPAGTRAHSRTPRRAE